MVKCFKKLVLQNKGTKLRLKIKQNEAFAKVAE